MRFVGLALISALAASGAAWGCQNAPSPGVGEAPADNVSSVAEKAPAARPGIPATSRIAPVALQGNDRLLAAGDPPRRDERRIQDPLIGEPAMGGNIIGGNIIGDVLIGDGEPMDDVDDAAPGIAEPDPDQAGAPSEPPSFPLPTPLLTATGAAQAEPQGAASENQQAR
jgi:hypothetical protein